MKFTCLLLALAVAGLPCLAASQDATSSDALRQKYEHTNIMKEVYKTLAAGQPKHAPEDVILPPLHYADIGVSLQRGVKDFSSISYDLDIKDDVPDTYYFYISPFTGYLNSMLFYGGLQTHSDGKKFPAGTSNEEIGRGGVFSRWFERNKSAIREAGYYASADGEGDFISARNKLAWHKGRYRVVIYKDGYMAGKPLPKDDTEHPARFSFGEYEQSWVGMKVIDLATAKETVIGELAFPGKTLAMSPHFAVFFEQYGHGIDYSALARPDTSATPVGTHPAPAKDGRYASLLAVKDLPVVHVTLSNLRVNGKKALFDVDKITYNGAQNPLNDKSKEPILAKVLFDKSGQTIDVTTGPVFAVKHP